MPRLVRATPKYRHHRATGQAVVTIQGRDYYLGPHGTKASKIEYDRLVGEWLAHGRIGAEAGATVAEFVAAYARYAEGYYGKKSREWGCMKLALRLVRINYSRTPVAEFGPLALKAVRQKMVDAGWSRTYTNHQVNRIRRAFKWGVENELVPASVLQALQAVAPLRYGRTEARETEPVRPAPDAYVDAVLPIVAPQVAAMIRLQRLTGMRPGEVVIMRGMDLDTSGKVWVYRPSDHKNKHRGHERLVYLGPQAQEVIKPFLRPILGEYLFRPDEAAAHHRAVRHANRKTPLSCGNRPGTNRRATPKKKPGDHYDTTNYRQAIRRACEKAKVPRWNPHQLRHNRATELRREYGLEVARIILGHKTAVVTQLYAEADQTRAVEVMGKIG